jgi:hypothetical protein
LAERFLDPGKGGAQLFASAIGLPTGHLTTKSASISASIAVGSPASTAWK